MYRTTPNKPAWGSVHLLLGDTLTNDEMAALFGDLGPIDEGNLTITTEKGKEYKLVDINGKVLEQLRLEPSLTIGATLLNPSEEVLSKFWTLEVVGEGAARKVKVLSLVNNSPKSFKLENVDAIGSATFEAAKSTVALDLEYAADKSYTGKVEVKLLWPNRAKGELFQFGEVQPKTVPSDPVVVSQEEEVPAGAPLAETQTKSPTTRGK